MIGASYTIHIDVRTPEQILASIEQHISLMETEIHKLRVVIDALTKDETDDDPCEHDQIGAVCQSCGRVIVVVHALCCHDTDELSECPVCKREMGL